MKRKVIIINIHGIYECLTSCRYTHAKYLAKRVEGIPFPLNLLAYSEIIGREKTKDK